MLALSLFPIFYSTVHETLLIAINDGRNQNSNDLNPDTVQLHKNHIRLIQTGTRTASAQLVLPPCDA